MDNGIIFFLGIAFIIAAVIFDASNTKDRIMGSLIASGIGCCIYGLVMGVASIFA